MAPDQSLTINALLEGYRSGRFTPTEVIDLVIARIEKQPDRNVWITRLEREPLQAYLDALDKRSPDEMPLYGIPFAIKDNIDLAGTPTTAACPEYAYLPQRHAFAVQCLIDAGAIPMGKTNLDQFATGLVGTRTPYGACKNSFNGEYISGGSSAGSAVAVATGQVSFSLGTDTAGSGRVPAAFNNIIGLKPTRGLISTEGVVPACRSLDCVSIFALTAKDAQQVLDVCAKYDPDDIYARPEPSDLPGFGADSFRFGVPYDEQLEYFGSTDTAGLFNQAVDHLTALGGVAVAIDFGTFLAAARLLYEGPWVTERYIAIESFMEDKPGALIPVTYEIIASGKAASAADAFKAQYQLMQCRRASEKIWSDLDVVVTPTAGNIYRIEDIEKDPVKLNSNLGYYTNFVNLLDLSAVAVPAGFQSNGLPAGVTLLSRMFCEYPLLALANRLQQATGLKLGATDTRLTATDITADRVKGRVEIAVCGAHLSGLALNYQLTERGAWLRQSTSTSDNYRLYALPGGPPYRPGLVRDSDGAAIEVEVWAMPQTQVGGFLQQIPPPLGLGKLELKDGRWVTGFICEPYGIEGASEVTKLGSWRKYLAENAD